MLQSWHVLIAQKKIKCNVAVVGIPWRLFLYKEK
jgi:hypothetical protein